jgi:branched-subunit amino acid transport protein
MLDTFFAQGNFIGFMHNMRLLAVIAATVSFIYSRKIWVSLLVGLVVWCSYTIYA